MFFYVNLELKLYKCYNNALKYIKIIQMIFLILQGLHLGQKVLSYLWVKRMFFGLDVQTLKGGKL